MLRRVTAADLFERIGRIQVLVGFGCERSSRCPSRHGTAKRVAGLRANGLGGGCDRLGAYKEAKYLHLETVLGLFKGFDDAAQLKRFQQATHVDRMTADEWCCTRGGAARYALAGSWKLE